MLNIKSYIILFLGLIILAISSCVPPEDEAGENDILLAKVYNKPLYLSDMEGMVPRTATPTDSTLIVNAFTDRWVKENLMIYEAERNIRKDLNIDELVRDYRASLILHDYEKNLAESELDSVITNEELMKYYDDYKSHFQLEGTIRMCKFMKLPSNAPNMKRVSKWWDDNDDEEYLELLTEYSEDNAVVYQLADNVWLTVDELEKNFPSSIISSLKTGEKLEESEGDFKYFVEVLETKSKNSEPPMAYIRERASNFILHNRKVDLVYKKREELFQNAERKGHVKYYN